MAHQLLTDQVLIRPMNHILRRVTVRMITHHRHEHRTEIIRQLMDRMHSLNLRLTIGLNSRIIFRRALRVVRKVTTISTRIPGITTIPDRINGAENPTRSIRGKIHRKRVLAPIRNRRIQGPKRQTIPKIHIKIRRHLTLHMETNFRKTLAKR